MNRECSLKRANLNFNKNNSLTSISFLFSPIKSSRLNIWDNQKLIKTQRGYLVFHHKWSTFNLRTMILIMIRIIAIIISYNKYRLLKNLKDIEVLNLQMMPKCSIMNMTNSNIYIINNNNSLTTALSLRMMIFKTNLRCLIWSYHKLGREVL